MAQKLRFSCNTTDDLHALIQILCREATKTHQDLHFLFRDGRWTCVMARSDGLTGRIVSAHADTLALAVCRFAVRVLVVKE